MNWPRNSPMQYRVNRTRAFETALSKALKSYPLSLKATSNAIDDLSSCVEAGDPYPGFGHTVRKLRLPLKAYSIGKSKGLRLVYMVLQAKETIVPLYIYKKGHPPQETDIRDGIRSAMKAILAELSGTLPSLL